MIEKYFSIKKEHIAPVQFVVEGYEGMAGVTTLDPPRALVKITIMPGFQEIMRGLLAQPAKDYCFEEIEEWPE